MVQSDGVLNFMHRRSFSFSLTALGAMSEGHSKPWSQVTGSRCDERVQQQSLDIQRAKAYNPKSRAKLVQRQLLSIRPYSASLLLLFLRQVPVPISESSGVEPSTYKEKSSAKGFTSRWGRF